jgi:threonine/homoserine/homoserine lactone efflux protein
MIQVLIGAFVLGLIGGVIPGPVLTAIFTEILQTGFLKSFRIIFWAMLTETVVALMSMVALTSLHLSEGVFRALSFIGAGILIWIAFSIWNIRKLDTDQRVHFSLGKISAMILANGVLWTFWITVCVPKAVLLEEQIHFGQYAFLVLVEVGWLCSTALVALFFSFFRKLLSHPKAVPVLFKLFALTFGYFALSMAYGSVTYFLQ